MASQWKIGDVVRLRSGGPAMTVTEVMGPREEGSVEACRCYFFGENRVCEVLLPGGALDAVTKEGNRSDGTVTFSEPESRLVLKDVTDRLLKAALTGTVTFSEPVVGSTVELRTHDPNRPRDSDPLVLRRSEPVGPEDFPGSDEGSHFMAQERAVPERRERLIVSLELEPARAIERLLTERLNQTTTATLDDLAVAVALDAVRKAIARWRAETEA